MTGSNRVLVIHDSWDMHGNSILFLKRVAEELGLTIGFMGSKVTTFADEINSIIGTIKNFNPTIIVIADIPVNTNRENDFIEALEKLARASDATVEFVDHHPQSKNYENAMKQLGVKPTIVNGLKMTHYLVELVSEAAMGGSVGTIEEPLITYGSLLLELVYKKRVLPMVIGNVADLDESVALAFRDLKEIGREDLVVKLREMAKVADYRLRSEGSAFIYELIRDPYGALTKSVEYPPKQLMHLLLKHKVYETEDVLVIDATAKEVRENVLTRGWLNKTVNEITENVKPYVVLLKVQRDRGAPRYAATINAYSDWTNLDSPVMDLVWDFASERNLKIYGHKGIVGMQLATSEDRLDLLARSSEYLEVAKELAEHIQSKVSKQKLAKMGDST